MRPATAFKTVGFLFVCFFVLGCFLNEKKGWKRHFFLIFIIFLIEKGNNPRRAGRRRKWKRKWIVKIQLKKKKVPYLSLLANVMPCAYWNLQVPFQSPYKSSSTEICCTSTLPKNYMLISMKGIHFSCGRF